MQQKKVIIFDGVPVCYSYDIAIHIAKMGHKILAVDRTGGKIEPEFIKLVRRDGGDGIVITPTEPSVAGLENMLDLGLSRYGRVNNLFFFRHFKDTSSSDFEAGKEKFQNALINFKTIYSDFLNRKGWQTTSHLFITASGEMFDKLNDSKFFNSAFEKLNSEFTTLHFSGNGLKAHPLKTEESDSVNQALKVADEILIA